MGCDGIEEIELPDTITEIGDSAFKSCKNLNKVIIPESVTKIDGDAFAECSGLILSLIHI